LVPSVSQRLPLAPFTMLRQPMILIHSEARLTGELAGLPGVSSVQTAPIIRTLKRTGSVL
jgi:hypothetical protein